MEMIRQSRVLRAACLMLGPALLAACVSGGANQPVNFGPAPPVGAGFPISTSGTLTFPGTGSAYAQTFTIDEPGYTGRITIDTSNCGSGSAALLNVSPTTISSFPATVTATPLKTGRCTVVVSDDKKHSLPIPVAINSAGVTVSGERGGR
jgi:hypothetical protein